MSAELLCARCFEPIAEEHLTETIVLGAGYDVGGGLQMETPIVHVDCEDPAGDQVYDCRRRLDMASRKSPKKKAAKKPRY